MWPDMVVLAQPLIDDGLSLPSDGEPFGVQDFPAQDAVEAFVIAILPMGTRIDLDRRNANAEKLVLEPEVHPETRPAGAEIFDG